MIHPEIRSPAQLFKCAAIIFVLILAAYQHTIAQDLILDDSFSGSVIEAPAQCNVSIVQPDGKILAGGTFVYVNGTNHRYLTRLNADGSVDASFNPGGIGPD